MHRVDASGHVANMFSPGDPANGIVPTQLDHEWHNGVQENICQLIEGAGIALVKGDHTQLMDAVAAMITTAQLTAAQILARLITVDGAGSALDADTVDGLHAAAFVLASNYTAADVLAKLLTVDGPGSGLNADLFDGQDLAAFLRYGVNVPGNIFHAAANNSNDSFGGLEIREAGLVAAAQSAASYAPGLNFHWAGRVAARLYMNAVGQFVLAGQGDITNNRRDLLAANLYSNGQLCMSLGNDGAGSGFDADLLDGLQAAAFVLASSYTAADVLAKLLTVDGAGSAVDADTVDGFHASAFALNSGFQSGTAANGYWRQLPDGTIEQWCVGVGAASGEATEFITFPMAFPTEVLGLTVSTQLGGASTGADVWYQSLAPSLTGVTVQRQKASGGSDGVTTIPRVYAIGR